MYFVDNCIELKIKNFREIASNAIFSKSFTVKVTQEYEVKVFFHSFAFKIYRRYSQFREFREKVNHMQLPIRTKEILAPFPKKKLLKSGEKTTSQRKVLLEKWLQSLLRQTEHRPQLLSFLSIPEDIIKSASLSTSCTLNTSEKIVAQLLRDLSKAKKKQSKSLKSFDSKFFSNTESNLSQNSQILLLKAIVPLCNNESVACLAIGILYRMVRIESYRFAEDLRFKLFGDMELLREMGLDRHILNEYSQETGLEGYFIAKMVKEQFDNNGLRYVLNFNKKAYEQFFVKFDGRFSKNQEEKGKEVAVVGSPWTWLNTDNYSGGLKVCFRKTSKNLEVKAEIFIESSLQVLSTYLTLPEKRKQWDKYLKHIEILKKIDDHTHWIQYTIKKDKKSPLFELLLETRKTESMGQYLITFHSIQNSIIGKKQENKRVECGECFYEVQNVNVKIRRSSSTTEEFESDNEDCGSMKSSSSVQVLEEKVMSKVVFFLKMKPDMARLFVTDLSEETSILKESLTSLKSIVEALN